MTLADIWAITDKEIVRVRDHWTGIITDEIYYPEWFEDIENFKDYVVVNIRANGNAVEITVEKQ